MNDKPKKNSIRWSREACNPKPALLLKSNLRSKQEGYSASYSKGVITVTGNNPISEAYGEFFFNSVVSTPYWPDFLGAAKPLLSLRTIWLECKFSEWLESQDDEKFLNLSKKIIQLGYNTLILGGIEEFFEESYLLLKPKLDRLLNYLNENHIKLALNLSSSSLKKNTDMIKKYENILNHIEGVHIVLVASHVDNENINIMEGKVYFDKLIEEIQFFEQLTHNRYEFIYYLPYHHYLNNSKQLTFLRNLSLKIAASTILAFPAVAGNINYNHLSPHPFWEEIRSLQENLGLLLMPVINLFRQRSPSISHDLLESFFSRCYRSEFVGITAYISYIPNEDELGHCNLWVGGQMQWRSLPPLIFIETWFKSFRPDIDYFQWKDLFRKARMIEWEISEWQQHLVNSNYHKEELRLFCETLQANLRILELKMYRKGDKNHLVISSNLNKEIKQFIKDCEKILLESARLNGINLISKFNHFD